MYLSPNRLVCLLNRDLGYYIWLKILLDWPSSLLDFDLLFLMPIPWIGPTIAPTVIALSIGVIGLAIVKVDDRPRRFRPGVLGLSLGGLGTGILTYSFMQDIGGGMRQQLPQPYPYWMLVLGLVLYGIGFLVSVRDSRRAA